MVGSTARKEVRLFSGCERPRCRFIRCGEREQDLALHGAAMAASEIIKHESEAAPPWTLFACDRRLPFGEPAADHVWLLRHLHWRNRLAFREPAGCAGRVAVSKQASCKASVGALLHSSPRATFNLGRFVLVEILTDNVACRVVGFVVDLDQ